MKSSLVVTIYNEEESVGKMLASLLDQSKRADEIIIVDGGSTDKTVEIVKKAQKLYPSIKLFVQKCTRAQGRNLGVEIAKNEIIVMTDAGCVADKNWLEKIVKPFGTGEVDMVAGFYKMVGESDLQNAMAVFLGVLPKDFSVDFLPSTRSVAFKKSFWEEVGGFPEVRDNSAEDTEFNYYAVKMGAKIARVKTARVEWRMPETLGDFFEKIESYAFWDARSGVWWHPIQRFRSHNIRALMVLLRYVLGLIMLILGFANPLFWVITLIGFLGYLVLGYRKGGLLTMVLQFVVDGAVIKGFVRGIIGKWDI